jgi:uncharacterized membrane protein YkgB
MRSADYHWYFLSPISEILFITFLLLVLGALALLLYCALISFILANISFALSFFTLDALFTTPEGLVWELVRGFVL